MTVKNALNQEASIVKLLVLHQRHPGTPKHLRDEVGKSTVAISGST